MDKTVYKPIYLQNLINVEEIEKEEREKKRIEEFLKINNINNDRETIDKTIYLNLPLDTNIRFYKHVLTTENFNYHISTIYMLQKSFNYDLEVHFKKIYKNIFNGVLTKKLNKKILLLDTLEKYLNVKKRLFVKSIYSKNRDEKIIIDDNLFKLINKIFFNNKSCIKPNTTYQTYKLLFRMYKILNRNIVINKSKSIRIGKQVTCKCYYQLNEKELFFHLELYSLRNQDLSNIMDHIKEFYKNKKIIAEKELPSSSRIDF